MHIFLKGSLENYLKQQGVTARVKILTFRFRIPNCHWTTQKDLRKGLDSSNIHKR